MPKGEKHRGTDNSYPESFQWSVFVIESVYSLSLQNVIRQPRGFNASAGRNCSAHLSIL